MLLFLKVLVKIFINKPSSADYLTSTAIFNTLVEDVNNFDDPLTQLNALEMLSDMAIHQHGFTLLQSTGIFEKLYNFLNSVQQEENLSAVILLPGNYQSFFISKAKIYAIDNF